MGGRIRRIEIEDISGFSDTSIINELKEDYFKSVAEATVKPVIERLRAVYLRSNRRYPWNGILAVGLTVYKYARRGYDLDYVAVAKGVAKRWQLPDNVVREIVDAVLAEVGKA